MRATGSRSPTRCRSRRRRPASSTGDFYATGGEPAAIRDEIDRFAPAEAVIAPGLDADAFDGETMVSPFRPDAFGLDSARDRVAAYFGDPDTVLATDAEIRACGALLAYAEHTRAGEADRLDYLNRLTRYDPREHRVHAARCGRAPVA